MLNSIVPAESPIIEKIKAEDKTDAKPAPVIKDVKKEKKKASPKKKSTPVEEAN